MPVRQGRHRSPRRVLLAATSEAQFRTAVSAPTPVSTLASTRDEADSERSRDSAAGAEMHNFPDRRLKKMSTGWLLILILAVFLALSIREIPR